MVFLALERTVSVIHPRDRLGHRAPVVLMCDRRSDSTLHDAVEHSRLLPDLSRRAALLTSLTSAVIPALPSSAKGRVPLAPRLNVKVLKPLTASGVPSKPGELRYPPWMLGNWNVI